MVFQSLRSHFFRLLTEEEWRMMAHFHVLFQRSQVFETYSWLAVSAAQHVGRVYLNVFWFSLLVLCDDCIKELKIIITAYVLLFAWLALLLLPRKLVNQLILVVRNWFSLSKGLPVSDNRGCLIFRLFHKLSLNDFGAFFFHFDISISIETLLANLSL